MTQRWPVVVAAAYAHLALFALPFALDARDAWAIERIERTPDFAGCIYYPPPLPEAPLDPCGGHRRITRDLVQPDRDTCEPRPVEPVHIHPPLVPPDRLHRISGLVDIQPPDAVKSAMVAEGKRRLVGSYKLCLDTLGRVHDVTRSHSTGYDTYDQRLAAAMWNWRYQPFVLAGRPREVCTTVTFTFTFTP